MVFCMLLFLHDDNELLRILELLKGDYFNGNGIDARVFCVSEEGNKLYSVRDMIFSQLIRTFITIISVSELLTSYFRIKMNSYPFE